jgi:hypothetical protein
VASASGKNSIGMGQHLLPAARISAMTLAGTRPSVTSMAVSIIDSMKPLMPNP